MPKLKVVSMDGKTKHIEIDGDDTIENILDKVADITGIPYRLQKLICEDKEFPILVSLSVARVRWYGRLIVNYLRKVVSILYWGNRIC